MLRTLRAENVDTTRARVEPDAPTGLILFEARTADVIRVCYYRAAPLDRDWRPPPGSWAPKCAWT